MTPRPNRTVLRRQLGAALRQLREDRGLTRAQLADAVGMRGDSLGQIERAEGRTLGRTVRRILAVLDVEGEDAEAFIDPYRLAMSDTRRNLYAAEDIVGKSHNPANPRAIEREAKAKVKADAEEIMQRSAGVRGRLMARRQ